MTDSQDRDEALQRLARTQAKLSRHERRTGIVLAILTAAAVVALGLLIGHIAGVPWLSLPH
jgi:predicted phosphoribosyltransferase